jgi:hypothetical protein
MRVVDRRESLCEREAAEIGLAKHPAMVVMTQRDEHRPLALGGKFEKLIISKWS